MSSYPKNKLSPTIKNKIDTLNELFPDWTPEDLIDLVQEYDDLETIIDKITSGAVTRWDEVKKPSKKERKQQQYENSSDIHYTSQYSHTINNNTNNNNTHISHNASSNITHSDNYNETNTNHSNTRRSKYNNSASQRTTKRYPHLPNKQPPLKPVHVQTKAVSHTNSWADVISSDMRKRATASQVKVDKEESTSNSENSDSNTVATPSLLSDKKTASTVDSAPKKMSWAAVAAPKQRVPIKKQEPLENVSDLKKEIEAVENEDESPAKAETEESTSREEESNETSTSEEESSGEEESSSEEEESSSAEEESSSEEESSKEESSSEEEEEEEVEKSRKEKPATPAATAEVKKTTPVPAVQQETAPTQPAAATPITTTSTTVPANAIKSVESTPTAQQATVAAAAFAAQQQYYMYQNQFPGYTYPGMYDSQTYAAAYGQQQYPQYNQYQQYQQYQPQGLMGGQAALAAQYGNFQSIHDSAAMGTQSNTTPGMTKADVSANNTRSSPVSPQAQVNRQQQQQQPYGGNFSMPYYGHFYQQSFPYGQPQYGMNAAGAQYPYGRAASSNVVPNVSGSYNNYYQPQQGKMDVNQSKQPTSTPTAGQQDGTNKQEYGEERGATQQGQGQHFTQTQQTNLTPQQLQYQQYYQLQQIQAQQQQQGQRPYSGYTGYDYSSQISRGYY